MTRKEESKFRSKFLDALKPLKAFAVENQLCLPGTPDVFYDGLAQWTVDGDFDENIPKRRYCGMAELKRATAPVRDSTKLSVTIQPGQKPFWADAHERGAVCNIVVQVEMKTANRYLWLDGKTAVELLDVAPLDVLSLHARSWIQADPRDGQRLKRWIRRCVMV